MQDAHASLAAKQYRAFIIGRQTCDFARASDTGECIGSHLIEVLDVHCVKSLIEGDGFNVNIGPQQFSCAGLDIDGAVQHRLRATRQVYAQVLQTFFVTAAVIYLSSMDTNGLLGQRVSVKRAG